MAPDTAKLFPNATVVTDFGEIPEGWRWASVRELSGYLSRGIGPVYIEEGGVCVLNQKCIRDRRVDFAKARRHDPTSRSVDGRWLRELDILVNSTGVGTLGRVAQLWDLPEPAIVDSHITVIRSAEGVDPWFLGTSLLGREVEIEALGEGSTGQTELSRTRLGDLPCLAPDTRVQEAFGALVAPMFKLITTNERESVRLGRLRDALSPRLIAGHLRLKDVERFTRGDD